MGVFPEDERISVSKLIKLWVSEGFVRPISGKSLEEVGHKYLEELISRNMVLAHELGSIGSIKYCKIHDLLRDLSLRQAAKEMFYGTGTQRRIVVSENMSPWEVRRSVQFMPFVRSVICHSKDTPRFHKSRLLRILSCPRLSSLSSQENEYKFINSRYILLYSFWDHFTIPTSFYSYWNLQTLIVSCWICSSGEGTIQLDIWNMPQLRHLKIGFQFNLSDLPSSTNHIVLANLQTLKTLKNFKCCLEVVKRIPNIKKLKVVYMRLSEEGAWDYCLNNFRHLHKLESLYYHQHNASGVDYLQNFIFPHSLKKLTIQADGIPWEDKLEKIGSLPLLEKLELMGGCFRGGKWETIEGHFTRLRFLGVEYCRGLEYWITESSHLPCLERLVLSGLSELNEIPSEIGEIPTMRSIKLMFCSVPLAISAKKIVEEAEELYGEVALQVQAFFHERDVKAMSWLAGPNFQIR